MDNISLTQKNYVDFVASLNFASMKVSGLQITVKTPEVDGKKTPILNFKGTQLTTGIIVNKDMFPRNEATEEDLANLPETVDDAIFRIGFYQYTDLDTGEQMLRQGEPKWIAYVKDGKTVNLSGDKRAYKE